MEVQMRTTSMHAHAEYGKLATTFLKAISFHVLVGPMEVQMRTASKHAHAKYGELAQLADVSAGCCAGTDL